MRKLDGWQGVGSLLVLLVLAGCGAAGPPSPGGGDLPAALASPTAANVPSATPAAAPALTSLPALPADAQAAVDTARADLARRLGVDAAAITVASVVPTTWTSLADLGCPGVQPIVWRLGQLVPGTVITLQHAAQDYIYHAGGGQVVYCDPMVMQPPPP
jgi:hypothetical protein